MLNIFKKGISFIVALGIAFLCTACAKGNEDTNYTERLGNATIAYERNNESGTIAIEEHSEYAGIYEAEPQRFSDEDINRFLSYCGDSIAYSQEEDGSTSARYWGTTDSGKQFLRIESTGYHPHVVFQYMDQEKYGTYSAYPIYSGEEQYENNTQFNVGWMFAEAKDFSFATAKEAEGAVRAALSVLGVSDLILLRTLYIDHNIMEAAGKKLATEPQYAPIGETKENNGYPIREDWSSADDAYMFSFGISVNGTPLATRFEVRDTSTYIGSQIIVWYSADGIDCLSVDMPWKVESAQITADIVPPQVAIDVAKAKMEGILTIQDPTYSNACLEYQYRQDNNQWILFPVWTIKVTYQFADDSSEEYEYISVNALTGEEI